MKTSSWILLVAVFIIGACNSNKIMEIKIVDRLKLDQIPSASGIERINGHFWIIGDNSPWLFELNDKFILLNKYEIFSTDSLDGNTIPKKRKHDFEAMTQITWERDSAIFIFGSGSKSPERNWGKLIQFGKNIQATQYDLSKLYEQIMEEAKLDEEELNIEAAAVLGDKLYLFNRGKNKLISISTKDFYRFLKDEKQEVKIKAITIDLPTIDGVQAGFSGAFADEKNKRLIFSASVENTSNWIDDGAILGSLIGVIKVSEAYNHYTPVCHIIMENESPLLVKVESVSGKTIEKDKLTCLVVTDSDGTDSELLELEIELKK